MLVLQNRQGLPCPQGTFKVGLDFATACTPCPNGLTTVAQASTVPAACELAATLGSYVTTVDGVLTAQPCPRGSYSSNGRTCTPCFDGLDTATEGASNVASCQAGPGYGYDPALSGTVKKYQCPGGTYKVSKLQSFNQSIPRRAGPTMAIGSLAMRHGPDLLLPRITFEGRLSTWQCLAAHAMIAPRGDALLCPLASGVPCRLAGTGSSAHHVAPTC